MDHNIDLNHSNSFNSHSHDITGQAIAPDQLQGGYYDAFDEQQSYSAVNSIHPQRNIGYYHSNSNLPPANASYNQYPFNRNSTGTAHFPLPPSPPITTNGTLTPTTQDHPRQSSLSADTNANPGFNLPGISEVLQGNYSAHDPTTGLQQLPSNGPRTTGINNQAFSRVQGQSTSHNDSVGSPTIFPFLDPQIQPSHPPAPHPVHPQHPQTHHQHPPYHHFQPTTSNSATLMQSSGPRPTSVNEIASQLQQAHLNTHQHHNLATAPNHTLNTHQSHQAEGMARNNRITPAQQAVPPAPQISPTTSVTPENPRGNSTLQGPSHTQEPESGVELLDLAGFKIPELEIIDPDLDIDDSDDDNTHGHDRFRTRRSNQFMSQRKKAPTLFKQRESAASSRNFRTLKKLGRFTPEEVDAIYKDYSGRNHNQLDEKEKEIWSSISEKVIHAHKRFELVPASKRVLMVKHALTRVHQDAFQAFGLPILTVICYPGEIDCGEYTYVNCNYPNDVISPFHYLHATDQELLKRLSMRVREYANNLWDENAVVQPKMVNIQETKEPQEVLEMRRLIKGTRDGIHIWHNLNNIKVDVARRVFHTAMIDRLLRNGHKISTTDTKAIRWKDYLRKDLINLSVFPKICENGIERDIQTGAYSSINKPDMDAWMQYIMDHQNGSIDWEDGMLFVDLRGNGDSSDNEPEDFVLIEKEVNVQQQQHVQEDDSRAARLDDQSSRPATGGTSNPNPAASASNLNPDGSPTGNTGSSNNADQSNPPTSPSPPPISEPLTTGKMPNGSVRENEQLQVEGNDRNSPGTDDAGDHADSNPVSVVNNPDAAVDESVTPKAKNGRGRTRSTVQKENTKESTQMVAPSTDRLLRSSTAASTAQAAKGKTPKRKATQQGGGPAKRKQSNSK